jgi:hypothetical protein
MPRDPKPLDAIFNKISPAILNEETRLAIREAYVESLTDEAARIILAITQDIPHAPVDERLDMIVSIFNMARLEAETSEKVEPLDFNSSIEQFLGKDTYQMKFFSSQERQNFARVFVTLKGPEKTALAQAFNNLNEAKKPEDIAYYTKEIKAFFARSAQKQSDISRN